MSLCVCVCGWIYAYQYVYDSSSSHISSIITMILCKYRFTDVRAQLRKDLGYTEDDKFSAPGLIEPSKTEKSLRSPSMCSVSSGGQSSLHHVSPSARRSVSKSPDCVSSRAFCCQCFLSVCVPSLSWFLIHMSNIVMDFCSESCSSGRLASHLGWQKLQRWRLLSNV